MLSQDDNLFSGSDTLITDPPPAAHSSLSPEHIYTNPPLANDLSTTSPTITAAVGNLLSSFDSCPDALIPIVQPDITNSKSYGRKTPGLSPLNFHLFVRLPLFQDLRFLSLSKTHQSV
jgi:hypothetical protein